MGSDNNVVIVFLNKMTDMFLLNILFIIGCLPIFTVGASLSAMYAVNLRSVRYGDGYVVKTFLAFYKKCFKQATVAWIVFVILGLLLFFDYRFWSTVDFGGVIEKPMMILSLVIAFVVLMIFEWLFPVIAKLDDSLMVQLKNSAKMAIGYFVPYTVLCIGITALVSYLRYIAFLFFIIHLAFLLMFLYLF